MTVEDFERNFTYQPVKEGDVERYKSIRDGAKELASTILKTCKESRERSIAITNLEQMVMWANASIAREEREYNE